MRVESGTVVDRWTILRMLGRGGMAVVYLARHNQLGSLHAIKILTLPTPTIQARLLQEGRAQSSLRHSNVVAVTDLVEIGGSTGLVMEWIEGPSLHRLLRAHLIDIPKTDLLVRGILKGVAAAHAHGLVHRDLKPANILIAVEDSGLVPKITDFGLTKVLGQDMPSGASHTRAGLPMGTPSYMAPEQIQDASQVDGRADVFALGAILYEMVCGQRAFLGEDVVDTYTLIRRGIYRDPLDLEPTLPTRMVEAIRGALQVSPSDRVHDVGTLLEMWRGGPAITDRPVERWPVTLLEDIRALGQEHTRSAPPETPAYTPAASSETWADLDIAPSPTATAITTPAHDRRPWRPGAIGVFIAVVAVLMIAIGVLRPTSMPSGADQVLEVESGLRIHEDPVIQQEFDAGWEALLDADFDRSVRRLGVVVDQAPDHPLPWLVHWRALRYADRSAESLISFWAALEHTEGQTGAPVALTLALVEARRHSWEGAGQGVLDYLAAHPRDFFGRLAAIGIVPLTDEAQAHALLAEAKAIDSRPAILPYIEASRALQLEHFDEAKRVVEAGLSRHPRSPTLLALQGEILLKQGAFAPAREALILALNEDPGMHLARTRLGGAQLMLGDDDAASATTRQMMRSPTRWDHRVRYATYVSEVLIGLGRFTEAVDLLRQAEVAASEENQWLSVITLRGTEAIYHLAVDNTEAMTEATLKLIDISHNPEIPDAERETLVRNLLYAKGMTAVRRGDVEEAQEILARLKQVDRVWAQYLEYLEREIAIAQQDATRVSSLMTSIPDTCAGDLERGHYLWLAGDLERAAEWLTPRLASPHECAAVGETRLRLADSHLILAQLALQRGEGDASVTHLDAFDALWPNPDPQVPFTRRSRELRASGVDLRR